MSAEILKGAAVSKAIHADTEERIKKLNEQGITPTLAIVRVGDKPDDIYYENAATKKAEAMGIAVEHKAFGSDIAHEALLAEIKALSEDKSVNGVLILRPLPKTVDETAICGALSPEKDVDGITPYSLYGVFAGQDNVFAPCTARACIEILDWYGIKTEGKKVAVIGRSMVIGRPVTMMLMKRNATVTICHTRTKNVAEITKNADIIVTSAGAVNSLGEEYVSPGQTVIDVSMNQDEHGNMHGDADFEAVSAVVSAITPVPGGVGSVTTAILLNNTVIGAMRQNNIE